MNSDIFTFIASKIGVQPMRVAQGTVVLGVILMIAGHWTGNLIEGIGVAFAVGGVIGMSAYRGTAIERGPKN